MTIPRRRLGRTGVEVTTAVVGCDDLVQVEENVRFARSFEPMGDDEMQEFVLRHAGLASRLMYYKP